LPKAIGDLSALLLQNLHLQLGGANDAERAAIEAQAAQVRRLLAASEISHTRETNIRELQPVTRVPVNPYGAKENVANIRMNNIPVFTGGNSDTIDVINWISRVFNLAEARQLTFNATINLLIQGSSKGAASYIDEMKQEGKTLYQIIQQLEMRYGSLTTVEDARIKCNNMTRKPDEHLSDFIDSLRLMAKMACRQEPTEPLRRRAIDILVEGNIRRVLPSSVRAALEERIMNRSLMGLPALSARDIEKECLDLEAKRKERKLELKGLAQGKRHNINVAKYDVESNDDSSESSDDQDDEENPQELLINEIKQQQLRYFQRGKPVNGPKVMKRAFKQYNQKYQGRYYNKPGQYVARQAGLQQTPVVKQTPPNKLDAGFKPINELLLLANCSKGQCIQCGFDGHLMRNMACALKDKPLMDKACAKCGKGLHAADDCPKVYQQGYKAPAEPENQAKEALN